MKSIFITVIALSLTMGCLFSQHADHKISSVPLAGQLNESKVVEIAKYVVAQNETWADFATYEAQRFPDGTWGVTVWRVTGYYNDGTPKFSSGSHRVVIVDSTGKVIEYIRGL
jgi:hypothetical protein